ncbi:hypothetical protein U2446_15265, partial [Listeria monocytogenes]|uniref:hypothetical protein n=1 Tax=Listeria monocytogenes TaxID=1639 RepID=UPI002FDC04CF
CLFKDNQEGEPIFLIVWVDDIFMFSPVGTVGRTRKNSFIQGMLRLFPHGLKVSNEDTKVYHCLGLVVAIPLADP